MPERDALSAFPRLVVLLVLVLTTPALAAMDAVAPGASAAPAPPPPPPWWTRWGGLTGGASWQIEQATGVRLRGQEFRVGIEGMRRRGQLRLGGQLQLVGTFQGVGDVFINNEIVRATGSGFRRARLGMLSGFVGVQGRGSTFVPYVQGGLNLVGGTQALRLDFIVSADTLSTPLGTIYGYEFGQGFADDGRLIAPGAGIEVGGEFRRLRGRNGAWIAGVALVGNYWPSIRNASLGLIVHIGRERVEDLTPRKAEADSP